MPWRVGIDEAGYGPNLGPLVMTAVACNVPPELADGCLWRALRPAVRRCRNRHDPTRLLVDDSKLVYSTARGLGALEASVLGILGGTLATCPTSVAALVDRLHADHELAGEPWYGGATTIPLATAAEIIADGASRFRAACTAADITWPLFRCVIVCPAQFNVWVEQWGSKGAVLSAGLVQLLNAVQPLEPGEAMHVTADKHGGRNFYSAVLQEAFPAGWAMPLEEGMDCSSYQINGLDRPMRVTFRPRADSGHFEVALASMISKYVREALMAEFNAFWKKHLPELAPTAGYPVDAKRFLSAIRPALARLQIAEATLWRTR